MSYAIVGFGKIVHALAHAFARHLRSQDKMLPHHR